jgi:hypothetical protein
MYNNSLDRAVSGYVDPKGKVYIRTGVSSDMDLDILEWEEVKTSELIRWKCVKPSYQTIILGIVELVPQNSHSQEKLEFLKEQVENYLSEVNLQPKLEEIALNRQVDLYNRWEAIDNISSQTFLRNLALDYTHNHSIRHACLTKLKDNILLKSIVSDQKVDYSTRCWAAGFITSQKVLRELYRSTPNYRIRKEIVRNIEDVRFLNVIKKKDRCAEVRKSARTQIRGLKIS